MHCFTSSYYICDVCIGTSAVYNIIYKVCLNQNLSLTSILKYLKYFELWFLKIVDHILLFIILKYHIFSVFYGIQELGIAI